MQYMHYNFEAYLFLGVCIMKLLILERGKFAHAWCKPGYFAQFISVTFLTIMSALRSSSSCWLGFGVDLTGIGIGFFWARIIATGIRLFPVFFGASAATGFGRDAA